MIDIFEHEMSLTWQHVFVPSQRLGSAFGKAKRVAFWRSKSSSRFRVAGTVIVFCAVECLSLVNVVLDAEILILQYRLITALVIMSEKPAFASVPRTIQPIITICCLTPVRHNASGDMLILYGYAVAAKSCNLVRQPTARLQAPSSCYTV